MAISNLSSASPALSDQVPFSSVQNGEDRKASLSVVLALFQTQLTAGSSLVTQYFAPNATGWTVTVLPILTGGSIWLLITPVAGYAAGTITLPPVASCVDGQETLVTCSQSVTVLTTIGNGATVYGAPTTLAANASFRLRFEGVTKVWYRISN